MDSYSPVTVGPQWSVWDYIPSVSSFLIAGLLGFVALFLMRHWLMVIVVLVAVVIWAYMIEFIEPEMVFSRLPTYLFILIMSMFAAIAVMAGKTKSYFFSVTFCLFVLCISTGVMMGAI